jgi:porin
MTERVLEMKHTVLCASAIYLCLTSFAFAEEGINYKGDTLTGDWGGARQTLSDHGVDTEIVYKLDVMGNTSGGIKEGTRLLDNLDVMFSLDGEKLAGLHGTSAFIHFLNNNGGRPDNDLVGSAQGIDNIEVPKATAKLYQAWIQQNLFDDKVSVLAGLYDTNSEFYVNDPAGLFIHSTYGIGTEVAATGMNGPSIFPFTAAGVRLKIQPTPEFYVMSAVLDGVPGDPNNPNGTHVHFRDGDGAFVIAEAGYTPEKGKVAVGGWYYTEKFPDQTDPVESRSQGAYIIGDYKVYCELGSCDQGLSAFARFGVADDDINQFDYAWAAGLVYTGLIPGRDEGQLGLGIDGAHNGDPFKNAAAAGGTPVDTAETNIELTYSDNITPWLAVQPDVQYVINPGTDPALDDALVLGTRFTVSF